MAKFPLYQWKKATGTGDTTGLAKLNANNTFTGKNTFESTANVVSIKSTDDQSFGIEFENNTGQRVGYIGTSNNEATKATVWGANGLILQTTNKDIYLNSGTAHLLADSTKPWNNYLDNSVLRLKDLKWSKLTNINYTSIVQPTNTWNRDSWNWTLSNLTSTNGFIEIIVVFSWADNQAVSLKGNMVWKNGLTSSKSSVMVAEKNDRLYYFQFEITNGNVLKIATKHDNQGTGGQISWVRAWIKRGLNAPDKVNTLW